MFPVLSKPEFVRGNDCLQTRSRRPRLTPPNFALLCDWVIWEPGTVMGTDAAPTIIYLRADTTTIPWFVETVLPELTQPFTLVTASHDTPMPAGWAARINLDWEQLLAHPYLVNWFAENRDVIHANVHALTLGIPQPDLPSWISGADASGIWDEDLFAAARSWRRNGRPDSVFACWFDRTEHPSGTSPADDDERAECRAALAGREFVAWHDPGMPHVRFLDELRRHRFVLCPHGGGLDPSPKAWEALQVGTIPIIKRNSTTAAFGALPAVIVDDWSEVEAESLANWHELHRPAFISAEFDHLLSNQALLDRMRHAAGM